MKNNKFYVIANIARSLDKSHIKSGNIHLVSSIFYTEEDKTSNLSRYNENYLIIRVLHRPDDYAQIIEHNSNIKEFQCSISHLFIVKKDSTEGNTVINFLKELIGEYAKKEKDKINLLKNVIFIFEDIEWQYMQSLLSRVGLKFSGGTISRRQLLSTTNFLLSKILTKMGYNEHDVFNSQNILSLKLKGSKARLDPESYDFSLYKEIVKNEVQIAIKSTLNNIQNLEDKIKVFCGNIDDLESKTVIKHKRRMIIERSIKDLKRNIEEIKGQISEAKALEQQLREYSDKLNNSELSITELEQYYYAYLRDIKLDRDQSMLDDVISEFNSNLRFNKNKDYNSLSSYNFNSKREYCTLSRLNNKNNLKLTTKICKKRNF